MTPSVTERIARELAADEPEARRIATKRIAEVRGREAGALLLRALGDEDWRVRKEAAQVAASLEPRAQVIDALVGALHEANDVGLRNAAVEALVAIGQDAIPRIEAELPKLDADGRKLAIEALGGLPDPRGARAIAPLLADPDANVRCAAAEALGRAGASGDSARDAAIAQLTRALGDPEIAVVLAALGALGALEAPLAWSVLAPLAKNPVLRRHALAAGAAARAPEAIAELAGAVGDPSPTIARDAVVSLADWLLERDDSAVERARAALAPSLQRVSPSLDPLARLRGWAAESDTRVRGAALTALGLARREEDVPRLVGALADDAVADRAELALQLFGQSAVEPLIAAGHDAPPAARGASISIVPMLGATSQKDLAEVRDALRSPQPDVVIGALKALSIAGGAREIAPIVELARHPEPRIANAALATLFDVASREPRAARAARVAMDPAGPDAAAGCVLIDAAAREGGAEETDLAFLTTSLAQGGVLARRAALEALATLGGERAADAAAFALADEEREVVLAAARAMGRLGHPEPLERLAVSTEDPVLVAPVLRALGEADPARLVRAALPLVESAQPSIACAAVEALGSRRARGDASTELDDALFAALDHPDPEVVKLALSEIGAGPDARALARLGMCLDHEAPDVRRLAGELLGDAGGQGAHALLRARLARERDPAVRDALTVAVTTRPHPHEDD